VINGQEILERHEWAGTYIPVIPVYGDQTNIEGETIRQGLTDRMQDSQQMYNFLITMAAEAAALQPKAPWLVPEGAIDQRERDWGMANTKNLPYLVYRATDEMGKPLPPPQRSSPDVDVQGMLGQAALFQQDMRLVSGVPDPTAQMQTQDQSGRAILAKERVSATSTYHFVDNLSRALRYTGRILLDAIPHYYDTQRTLMLLREDGSQYKTTVNQAQPQTAPVLDMHGNMIQEPQVLPPFNDLTTGKYDCVVDTGPSYASKRVEFVNSVMDLTQSNPALWQVAGDLLVKNMDWPGAEDVADRLKVMLPPPILQMVAQKSNDPQVTAMAAQMQQLQQDSQQHQTQVLQEKASSAKMSVQMAMKDQDVQQKQAEIAASIQEQQMKSQDTAIHAHIDQQRAVDDRMQMMEEANLKREQLNLQTFQALIDAISKLGPQVGAQGIQTAEQALPGTAKEIEMPDMAPIHQALAEHKQMLQTMMQPKQAAAPQQDLGQALAPVHEALMQHGQVLHQTMQGLGHLLQHVGKPQAAAAPAKRGKRRYRIYKDKDGSMVGESADEDAA